MVVIEVEETNNVNPPKSKSKSRSTSTSASANRDASDGFETASDAELPSDGDDEDYNNDGGGARDIGEQQQPQGELEDQKVAPQVQSEGTLNDDERKQQKALAQANDSKLQGNKLFGNGQYEEALLQYELALQFVPAMSSSVELCSICHANRAVCFLKLGKYDETIKECTKALELNPTYMKALIRRGEAYEKLERFEEAIVDLKKILELDPSNDQARKTIHRLEPLAEEKREKMKEEMIGKLKEMGNSLLGRFGMSVDNFKAVKDPNSGSYSISFQR
ncbi:tetratricopeptide repeat protein 1 isoform X1 [Juglans microcarpa x Juglans regia]|uniref:tetratricopeptide repeat protein 1 isoform X1 n=1 Tax=Juglans microcarpa x Juglans regia TaxID=2249226 RepID=UPI001B7F6F1C|nr:tetratricopeptide repeat protein 1 isoform X1 [Juglans microcarpa x Juglans regia]